jgi:asparagine synthase (glutamine-hydrolysing)
LEAIWFQKDSRMCGIAGFNLDKDNASKQLFMKVCADSLSHRGPDYAGFFSDEQVNFIHTRLKILDLNDRANQPLSYNNGQIVITFNGEIYNYRELRQQLIKSGYQFYTDTDTEVVAAAYLYWGTNLFRHLDGMYAFAIYDKQRQIILLGRDPFGKKPLYYSLKGGLFFASELSVFEEVYDSLKVSLPAINQFLSIGYILDPLSPYEDVFLLPPSGVLKYNMSNRFAEISTHFSYADCFRSKHALSLADSAQQICQLLRNAVNKRWMGDVPGGIFLSGGLDSSVVAYLSQQAVVKIPAFSVGFSEKAYDESHHAERFCKELGLPFQKIEVGRVSLNSLNGYLLKSDFQTFDNSSFPIFQLSECAAKSVKYVLTGDGGDEIFGGYSTYQADHINLLIKPFLPFMRSSGLQDLLKRMFHPRHDKIGWRTKASRFFIGMDVSPERAHYQWRQIFNAKEREKLLGKEYRELVYDTDPIHQFKSYYQVVSDLDYIDQHLFVDSQTWLSNNNLIKLDRNTMAHGLEARCPFLDMQLVKFVAACPSKWKKNKQLLKLAFQQYLPDEIISRKKTGFNAPVGKWSNVEEDEFKWYTRLCVECKIPNHPKILMTTFTILQLDKSFFSLLIIQ